MHLNFILCMECPHELGYAHAHHISSSAAPGLCLVTAPEGPHFFKKNPQQKFLATGLMKSPLFEGNIVVLRNVVWRNAQC